MERPWSYIQLLCATFSFRLANAKVHEQILITTPPDPQKTSCSNSNAFKRQETCQFGNCGASCLSQGAFCCGPAGTLATSPYWVCDNGACITSVRGTTGIVDCYDPDNPSATTQSCIDNVPTTTCRPTDRCYTCLPAQPFCRWETYIAPNAPTLSWFSCVETKLPDTTFLAATITTDLVTTGEATASHTSQASKGPDDGLLPTGAIIGIAVGGTLVVVAMVALIVYCCLMKRRSKPKPKPPLELSGKPSTPATGYQPPTELDAQVYARSELNSSTTYSPQSQPISPFTPSDGYRRNFEGINTWRSGHAPVELQPQRPDYFAQVPRELHGETAEKRTSWGHGDDQLHMSPTTRF